MSTEIDGAAILGAMARNPAAFGFGKPQLDAIATAAVRSSLRDKSMSIAVLRSMAIEIGRRDFDTIVGALPAKDAKTVAKLDETSDDETAMEQNPRSLIMRLAHPQPEFQSRVPKILRTTRTASGGSSDGAPRVSKIGKIMASQAQATAGRARKLVNKR